MKVVAFNGSPRKKGNTYHALSVVGEQLKKTGIEFEIIHVGNKIVRSCIACMGCVRNKNEKCVIANDEVNVWIQKMKKCNEVLVCC